MKDIQYRLWQLLIIVPLLFYSVSCSAQSSGEPAKTYTVVDYFWAALSNHPELESTESIQWIRSNWRKEFLPYFTEIMRYGKGYPGSAKLLQLLEEKIGPETGANYHSFIQYLWSQEIENTPSYAIFKQLIHAPIDARFAAYFDPSRQFNIRLDEILWGGVRQDGIPPLRQPEMITAEEANYLDETNVVFGIKINGDARAYPKRILAWHEMFVDTVGGIPLAGVYCTLCGTVAIYETTYKGMNHELGTSGFLYRSNKLMYDKATQSLWSTMEGQPVVGPLTGNDITLAHHSVVTTTWGEWKKRHPDTSVLSLNTGHERNYDEGRAYREYFSTDRRMFETPYHDKRLKNKDEVLALRFGKGNAKPTVIAVNFLEKQPLYEETLDGVSYVILTDSSGANRAYARPSELRFKSWDQSTSLIDMNGDRWTLTEAALEKEDGTTLKRLETHRSFWFGWHSAFPETILIQ
ncbi:MAG: DUF3179 domain-containing protein [Verrucomicrobiota bacterium]